jgi:arylsulfatase A-like enzyme
LLTGRYQARFGFDTGPNEDNPNPLLGLPLTETILPQYLKSAGYVSGMIGKWHLGKPSFMFPTLRGFDEFVGFLDGDSIYYNADLYRGYTRFREKTYLTDAFTGEAVSFINNHAAEPFFLYLAYNAPHDPYQTPPDIYMQRVSYIPDPDRRLYAAMVCALDDGVGQVVQTLTANNILNNTLIFFLSDNGAPYWNSFDGTLQSNAPLRGYKLDMFDGGIRVPFAVQWPARIAPHTLYNGIVSSLDIVPTVAAATGISLPADRIFDGLDIMPYLTGEQSAPDRTLYWRWFGLGDTGPLGAFNPIWAVRSGPLKLVVSRAQDTLPPALFDLSQDIGEMTNLADEKPDLVASLSNLHKQWELIALPALWQKDSDNQLLPLVLAGDWNDFNINDTNFPWVFSHTPSPNRIGTPDAYNWLTSTIHVSSSGGDTTPGTHLFNIVADGNFKTQWGGTTINIDGITQVTSYSLNELAPPNSITFQDGYYYSVRLVDTDAQPRPHAFMPLSVMKTSAPPVSIIRTGQSPPEAIPGEPIVVTMTTSEPKSPEERVYLRWSNDWFITSHIIEATAGGDGVTYSATIPPQPAAITCYYTVLTSTADLNPLTTSGFIDELTLAVNGTFSALAIPTPTIVKQPADTKVADGQIAKFQASASGDAPLTYQWRKNGIDIPGATKAVYVSPATTLSDNGALFSAKVTNNRAIIVSRDALLTVQPNPPTIVTEPVDKTVRAGRSTKFSVTASGSVPLAYQWHKDGIDIPGATKATYKTPPTTSGDNGALFSVTVSNSAGSILSRDATLTVR